MGETSQNAGDAITSRDVTLVSEMNDVDRVDDTITLTVTYAADVAGETKPKRGDMAVDPPLELMVIDQHKLPSVEIASEGITIKVDKKDTLVKTLTEGETGTVKLVADRGTNTDDVPDDETIDVALKAMAGSTADSSDYDLRGSPVEIEGAAGKRGSGSFTLEVEVDQDVGPEELMLMATVSGDDMYGKDTRDVELGSISFVDATEKKIWPRTAEEVHAAIDKARMKGADDNGRWTAGETMALMASDLFDWPDTTTSVVLGNSISEDQQIATATTSNDSLMITAVGAAGDRMTEISVTATVVGEVSGFMPTQTISSAATVKFPIEVDAEAIVAMSPADVTEAVMAAIKKAADMASSKQWEPGGATAMVALSELFDVPESISAIYDAKSSDMSDVEADISSDKMYVTLMPKSAGTAVITVTAADTASGGSTATVSFDAIVMGQAAVVAKTPAEVAAVFKGVGADSLAAAGAAIMVPANELFTIRSGVTVIYGAVSSMPAVLKATASGAMVELAPLTTGASMITVTATDSATDSGASVTYSATVDRQALVVGVMTDPTGSVSEGGMVKVTATANRAVLADEMAVVTLAVTGPVEAGERSITIPTGGTMSSLDLTVMDDNMVSPMNDIVITASGLGIAAPITMSLGVTEDDVATTYSVAPPAVTVMEGGEGMTITVSASQPVLANTPVMLMHGAGSASLDDYDLVPVSITIMAGDSEGSTVLTARDDTDVEGMETVTLNAMMDTVSVGMVEVTIEDDDMETTYSVAPPAVTVMEGGEGMTITVSASQPVLANTPVMLMHGAGSASLDDYDLVPVSITIMAGDSEGSTVLTARDDTDVEGMETVTLNAMMDTVSVGMVEVTIEDDDMPTTYELTADTNMVEEGGAAATITASISRAPTEAMIVQLTPTGGSASDDDYDLDPRMITIAAGEMSGSAMLTATDDYDVEGMETLTLQGSIGTMIIGSEMFEIADNDMEISYELSSEDENIVEGDMDHANGTKAAAMLTATASSPVPMDTTVTIMRDGTSSAGMDDFRAEDITIPADGTVGTTMVMALEDNMPDSGHGMPEMLVLYGSVDGMNTNSVSFYIWDMAVPALPLIAQLLLAAFLAIGGYRRYLRR